MAKIICLRGKAGTGKTTVLKEVIAEIRNHPKTALSNGYPINNGKDQVDVVTMNGHKVGITTRGDNSNVLNTDFNKMGQCEFYICACRTLGETQDFLDEREKNHGDVVLYFHTWEAKGIPDMDNRNQKKRKEIVNLIKHFCGC